MLLKDGFLRMISLFTDKPIFKGFGETTSPVKFTNDPTIPKFDNLLFYKVKDNLGVFEVQKVITEPDGKIKYIFYHAESDTIFKMSKQWFDFFFEEKLDTPSPIDFTKLN